MKNSGRIKAACLALLLCLSLALAVFADDSAFIAENLEINTYRGVSVGGKLTVADSGSEVVGFEVTAAPGKGSVELGDDGCFVYTPDEGKKGKDYFGYKAIDAEGRYSQEATVIITIRKQKTRVTYADMEGHPSAWAAITLAEEGIFTGENLAGKFVFRPEESVTRGEFLTMCMLAAGTELMRDVSDTGFADDEAIAAWSKPYIGTALSLGLVKGYENELGWVFAPDEAISATEAAVMLDNILALTEAVAVWYSYDELLPDWAVQSAANLSACDIIPDSLSLLDETLSRAQAAEMLCAAMETVEESVK